MQFTSSVTIQDYDLVPNLQELHTSCIDGLVEIDDDIALCYSLTRIMSEKDVDWQAHDLQAMWEMYLAKHNGRVIVEMTNGVPSYYLLLYYSGLLHLKACAHNDVGKYCQTLKDVFSEAGILLKPICKSEYHSLEARFPCPKAKKEILWNQHGKPVNLVVVIESGGITYAGMTRSLIKCIAENHYCSHLIYDFCSSETAGSYYSLMLVLNPPQQEDSQQVVEQAIDAVLEKLGAEAKVLSSQSSIRQLSSLSQHKSKTLMRRANICNLVDLFPV